MNRRTYLATAGGVLLAGCTSSEGNPDDTTTTANPTTETTTQTPEQTTETTESPTPTPEETETETQTETTETPDEADQILNRIATTLDKVVVQYAAAAGQNQSFLDLNSTSGFSFDENSEYLYAARKRFNTLDGDLSDEQKQRRSRLRGAYWFLWWTGKTYEQLAEANYRSKNAVSRLYSGEYHQIESRADAIVTATENAAAPFSSLKKDSDAESLDAISELTPEDYETTVSQIETEISRFGTFADQILLLSASMQRLHEGFEEYLGERYDDASGTFYTLFRDFEELNEEFTTVDPTEALERAYEEFACITGALSEGCLLLDEAATAGGNEIAEKQQAAESDAREEFNSCDIVSEEIGSVAEFFDALPEERSY
ncbi:hypothetical protein ACFQJC_15600 [Haloferax namakaokahaiae]|uniref:Uncharacterized protein n=1 Tax=Haloferax namakaokahaiae TaxID=1748331 RepID=A0ABD5ZIT0_9EURY